MTFLGVANAKLILPNPQAFRIISEAKFNPLRANHTKMVEHTQFISNLPTNCLSVFHHFVILALKGLTIFSCV